MTVRKLFSTACVVVFVAWVSVSPARADLTPVFSPPSGEATHAQILDHIYGAGFLPSTQGSPSYTNGSVTATRIDDTDASGNPGSNLHLVFGSPGLPTTDQVWEDGIANVTAEAKFAAFSQEFGYDTGSGYVKLFDVVFNGPTGFDVSGSGSVSFPHNLPWDWVRDGTGNRYYSSNASNVDLLDHMVTYQITGASAANETVWLLLWEDLPGPLGLNADRDFNDLAVEIRATVIPVPAAAMLGLLGLGLVGWARKRIA
ncbi:MAG: DUF4114 domain-containing protein [Planctomycetes bacterium]|nr:DUF4114 domain-containing protein [Planctomycetota bacterium]